MAAVASCLCSLLLLEFFLKESSGAEMMLLHAACIIVPDLIRCWTLSHCLVYPQKEKKDYFGPCSIIVYFGLPAKGKERLFWSLALAHCKIQ